MANRSGESGRSNRFYFLGLQKSLQMVTAAMRLKNACSFPPLRKAVTNLESILKSRDITLLTKVYIVKVMIFPVVMYRCERWTTKKAEC